MLEVPRPPCGVASLSPGHRVETTATLMPSPHTTPRSETLPSSSGQRRSSFAPFRSETRWRCCRSSHPSGQQPRSELRTAQRPSAANRCVTLALVGPLVTHLCRTQHSSARATPAHPRGALSLRGLSGPEGSWRREEVQPHPCLLLPLSSIKCLATKKGKFSGSLGANNWRVNLCLKVMGPIQATRLQSGTSSSHHPKGCLGCLCSPLALLPGQRNPASPTFQH